MSKNLSVNRLDRMTTCRLELLEAGVDLSTIGRRAHLVTEHLEYFQMMLGDESTARQVLSLMRRDSPICRPIHIKYVAAT